MLPWDLRWRGPRKRKGQPADADQEIHKGRWFDGLDIPDLGFIDEGFGAFIAVLLFIVAIAAALLFVLPVFIFLIEVLIVALLVLGAILLRVVFRQPWLVDAADDDGTYMTWKVVGYRNARRVVDEMARQLQIGTREPNASGAVLVR